MAAVWRARGAEVTVSERTLEARRRGTRETVCPVREPRWRSLADAVRPGADIVVTDGTDPGDPGRGYVDAAALYELVAYGIDRGSADDICREFLDRPPTGGGTDRSPAGRTVTASLALAVAALVGLSIAMAAAPVLQNSDSAATAAEGERSVPPRSRVAALGKRGQQGTVPEEDPDRVSDAGD